MAVRDDFSAGEVLAAADLNDTFASKQADVMTTKGDLAAYGTAVDRLAVGTNGQVLTADSGETLGVKWADASGGLTLITADTFTSVSSFSVNDCFTAAYDNYRVIITGTGSSNSSLTSFRMRSAGTDATSANYEVQRLDVAASAASGVRQTGITSGWAAVLRTTESSVVYDILRPHDAIRTNVIATALDAGGPSIQMAFTQHTLANSYSGITFISAVGTITGIIRIYGYED